MLKLPVEWGHVWCYQGDAAAVRGVDLLATPQLARPYRVGKMRLAGLASGETRYVNPAGKQVD
jgi:hypothetical protein